MFTFPKKFLFLVCALSYPHLRLLSLLLFPHTFLSLSHTQKWKFSQFTLKTIQILFVKLEKNKYISKNNLISLSERDIMLKRMKKKNKINRWIIFLELEYSWHTLCSLQSYTTIILPLRTLTDCFKFGVRCLAHSSPGGEDAPDQGYAMSRTVEFTWSQFCRGFSCPNFSTPPQSRLKKCGLFKWYGPNIVETLSWYFHPVFLDPTENSFAEDHSSVLS